VVSFGYLPLESCSTLIVAVSGGGRLLPTTTTRLLFIMISSRSTNNLTVLLVVSIAVAVLSNSYCNAFTSPTQNFAISHKTPRYTATSSSSLLRSSLTSNTNNTKQKKNVIVISPPGGIGEITSLNTAKSGGHVKWFVVRKVRSVYCFYLLRYICLSALLFGFHISFIWLSLQAVYANIRVTISFFIFIKLRENAHLPELLNLTLKVTLQELLLIMMVKLH